jgi:hypothetical protein
METAIYLAVTVLALAAPAVSAVPYDPDRTFQVAGPCSLQEHVGLPGVLTFTSCDKLAHGLGGASVVLISFAVDGRTGRESCGRSLVRALLRAQAASATYELTAALSDRARWGQPGYGIGLRDHLAVTAGSLAAGGTLCGVRALLR